MYLQLVLDNPGPHTNLDYISGTVQLQVNANVTVSYITVKLEGESRTRLLAPPRPNTNERPRPNLEIHKLLYKVAKVFPHESLARQVGATASTNYIITPGSYSYPFSFKIPFNNACLANNTISTNTSFAGLSLEMGKGPTQHVKTTLPPSIYFPGEAEIRYYLKCTVNLPSILKPNPRAFTNVTFMPIEPPRPEADGETYARRQHQFIQDSFPGLGDRKGSTTGSRIFGNLSRKDSTPTTPTSPSSAPARISVDIRLPNPPILTCGEDVPLRIIVKQLSERNEQLFLQSLQIELIGYTNVRAHDAVRTETNGWVLISKSNINQAMGSIADPEGTETEISKEYWFGQKLHASIPPSFMTCNISRKYELKVSVGLSYGGMHGRGQSIVLPLHVNVEVFSGIKPPPELLKRLTEPPPNRPVKGSVSAHPVAPAYGGPSGGLPAQTEPGFDDAPPSYEDAIAQDLPPVLGPRPHYQPPAGSQGEESTVGNRKG